MVFDGASIMFLGMCCLMSLLLCLILPLMSHLSLNYACFMLLLHLRILSRINSIDWEAFVLVNCLCKCSLIFIIFCVSFFQKII